MLHTFQIAINLKNRMIMLRQKGFTLIEVMIVTSIISILAAITVPSYFAYVGKAQDHACLSEAKSYSNNVFNVLNDQDSASVPTAPTVGACHFITDATGWTLDTWDIIEATAKSPSDTRIECDIPNGSPCRILP